MLLRKYEKLKDYPIGLRVMSTDTIFWIKGRGNNLMFSIEWKEIDPSIHFAGSNLFLFRIASPCYLQILATESSQAWSNILKGCQCTQRMKNNKI